MRLLTSLVLAAASISQVVGAVLPRQSCGGTPTPFYRAFATKNADHFYTTSAPEIEAAITNSGYKLEGVAANVFAGQEASTVGVYRLVNAKQQHFYTISQAESDGLVSSGSYTLDGIGAFAYASQICGSIPFYRLFSPTAGVHYYTTSATERISLATSGYNDEGIAFYVFAA